MKRFRIFVDQKVTVWQNNQHVVEAENEQEAKDKIKDDPTAYCVKTETLDNTEEVIETDFENNFEIKEI